MTSAYKFSEINFDFKFIGDSKAIYGDGFPSPSTAGSVGFDLRAITPNKLDVTVPPKERFFFSTGVCIAPRTPNIAAFIYSRSGLGAKIGLTVAQGVGIIDPDYRGEIQIYMLNTSQETHTIRYGDRIAQMVIQPYFLPNFNIVGELEETLRGTSGFGHTGFK